MTAWLIAVLERLPPWVWRIVVAVVALVLIGGAITALRVAPSPGTGAVEQAGPASSSAADRQASFASASCAAGARTGAAAGS
jgi:hypothetical protein